VPARRRRFLDIDEFLQVGAPPPTVTRTAADTENQSTLQALRF
jgi:hypothetical protein